MELHNEIIIEAPADLVWQELGVRFMHVGQWAAPISASCPVGPEKPAVGVTRACTIAPFGPIRAGVVQERLTRFEPDRRSFEYEALSGMPAFIASAVNRWEVTPIDPTRSRLRIHATLHLIGPMRLLGWAIKWQMEVGGRKVAEEFKYFVEHGRPHPRKVAAASKALRARGLPSEGSATAP